MPPLVSTNIYTSHYHTLLLIYVMEGKTSQAAVTL